MPEGDTVYLAARRMAAALTGQRLTRGELRHPRLDRVAVRFLLHDMALLATQDEHRLVEHLGPDLLNPDWDDNDAAVAAQRLREQPSPNSVSPCSTSGSWSASKLCTSRGARAGLLASLAGLVLRFVILATQDMAQAVPWRRCSVRVWSTLGVLVTLVMRWLRRRTAAEQPIGPRCGVGG
ncbi:MAG: hypothetical protein ACRDRO_14340 [Pseudonocardiaceae bacterium]